MPFAKNGAIKPKLCKNGCGAYIYFDANSAVGKTAEGRWVPLLWNDHDDIATDEPHQCPKSRYAQQQQTQQLQPEQRQKEPIPISGPRQDDWETRLGLINGQVFARLDHMEASMKQIARAIDGIHAYFEQQRKQAKEELDELEYDKDKEDGFA